MNLPLRGIRVQLSGSVPDDATAKQAGNIRLFVEKFASAVFQEGGTLVHGSHPSFRNPLSVAAESFVSADGSPEALTLVRSEKYSRSANELSEIDSQRKYAVVQIIPADPGNSNESLVSMRDWMAERCDAVVAIGGRWYDVSKSRPGVPGELEGMLRRGKPGFVVASFGGAVANYLKDNVSLSSRLKNGLDSKVNETLAQTEDVGQLVARIIDQMKLLPLIRENVTSGRLFRVLALDGGGIRGAFTAAVLSQWDDMLKRGGDNGLVKHFDLVAGTSTGAILALGLGLGKAPKQILEFYQKEGPKIFLKNRAVRHWLKSKHDSATLRHTLEGVFGSHTMSDSCCRLVIPTVRAKHGEAEAIVTPHSADRTAFQELLAVDAALASSAAPTYFDEALIDNDIATQPYLDGGIWANNPVLPAIAEAVRHLKVPLDRIDVLSVGTMGNEIDFASSLGKGIAGWALASTDLFFAAQEAAAATVADSLLSRARHLRVNQSTPSTIPMDDVAALNDMAQRGVNVGKDSFLAVRSRFLDGFPAANWKLTL